MCMATTALAALTTTVAGIGSTILQNQSVKKNNEYKQQIALNQIKSARNEAQNQRQLGIDEARKEKIKGMQATSKLQAQNASNGFDTYSDTNLFNYEDTTNEYNNNAKDILDSYYSSAQKYDDKTKDYVIQMQANDTNAKNQMFKNTLNGLGKTTRVASNWYNSATALNNQGGVNGNF